MLLMAVKIIGSTFHPITSHSRFLRGTAVRPTSDLRRQSPTRQTNLFPNWELRAAPLALVLALLLVLAERLICSGPTLNRCLRQLPHRQPLEDLHARAREYFGMFIGSSQHNPKMSTLSGSLVFTSSLPTLHSLLPICHVPIFFFSPFALSFQLGIHVAALGAPLCGILKSCACRRQKDRADQAPLEFNKKPRAHTQH